MFWWYCWPLWYPFSDQISKKKNPYPFSDCSRFSDCEGDSPVSSHVNFVFLLSQFSGPNNLEAWNRLALIRQNYVIITRLECKKKFFKCISNSHISISFLFSWNWNDKYMNHICMLPVVSSKTIPDFWPKWAECLQTQRPIDPTLWGSTYLYGKAAWMQRSTQQVNITDWFLLPGL